MTTRTYRASAFLEAAEAIGVPVTVGSERTQALASMNPSGHLTLDFEDTDASVAAIERFAGAVPFDAVVGTDDDGVLLAARAAEALGLRHSPAGAILSARDKYRSRRAFQEAGLATPAFGVHQLDADPGEVAREVAFPCVLKPLALSASRGVVRADDESSFVEAFRQVRGIISRSEPAGATFEQRSRLLVEAFIPGAEIALEGLLAEGELRTLAVFDKPDPLDGPYFEETIYVTPSRHPRSVLDEASARSAEAARALGLTQGPVHVEMRVNERGVWILEVAPRTIGGLCARTLRFGEGVSLEEIVLRQALGLPVASYDRQSPAAGVMMIPIPRGGTLRSVEGLEEAGRVDGIEDILITIPAGQRLVAWPEGARYLGFIFARTETPSGAEEALREAHRRLRIVIEDS